MEQVLTTRHWQRASKALTKKHAARIQEIELAVLTGGRIDLGPTDALILKHAKVNAEEFLRAWQFDMRLGLLGGFHDPLPDGRPGVWRSIVIFLVPLWFNQLSFEKQCRWFPGLSHMGDAWEYAPTRVVNWALKERRNGNQNISSYFSASRRKDLTATNRKWLNQQMSSYEARLQRRATR